MTQFGKELLIRPANGSDLNFIYDTFRQSMKSDSNFGRAVATGLFNREFVKVIDDILKTAVTLIACYTSSPHTILGYLISEPGKIHYAFTKMAFREMGVQRELVRHAGLEGQVKAQFQTKMSYPIFEKHKQLIFSPVYDWTLKKEIK